MALMPKLIAGAIMYVGLATAASANCVNYEDADAAAKAPRSMFCGPDGCEEMALTYSCGNINSTSTGYSNGYIIECNLEDPSAYTNPNAGCVLSIAGRRIPAADLGKYSCYYSNKPEYDDGGHCAGLPSPCTANIDRIEAAFNRQSYDIRVAVQSVLQYDRHLYGNADGIWGRDTKSAVERFCMAEYRRLQLDDLPILSAADADMFWMTILDYGEMIGDVEANQGN